MTVTLGTTEEHEELRASVRHFLADKAPLPRVRELMETEDGTDAAVWRQAGGQLGLLGLAIPEAYGGGGFTFAEQAIVLEELGAALYGGPYLASAVLAATALLASPDEGARRDLLPGIASGETIATLAFTVGYAAAAVTDSPAEVPVLAPLVKAYASDTYFHVAAENIQIHGGIGFTWEHDAHLYFKRAKASELFLGDAAYHRERLATRIGL